MMAVARFSSETLRDVIAVDSWEAIASNGTAIVLVPVDSISADLTPPGSVPVVVVGIGEIAPSAEAASLPFDVVANERAAERICTTTLQAPLAATSLAVLLRGSEDRTIEQGLAAESAVYSLLQGGPEFTRWLTTARSPSIPDGFDDHEPVSVERDGAVLRIALNRPRLHNAFNRAMRDAVVEAFALARADASIERIEWSGRGPSFCSGGDLSEFGTFADVATSHRTRLVRSPARLAYVVADRLHVRLHGACMGAGIELPAFAHHVVASRDATISLPELALGLIPGAGGTVSLPRRIGRLRTAALALSGRALDAGTALDWGLIDEIE